MVARFPLSISERAFLLSLKLRDTTACPSAETSLFPIPPEGIPNIYGFGVYTGTGGVVEPPDSPIYTEPITLTITVTG